MGTWPSHLWGVFFFLVVVCIMAMANFLFLPRLRPGDRPGHFPLLSVLIPARDEEENIEGCLRSVLSQDYPWLEVLILDDGSSDDTDGLVERLASSDERIGLLRVSEPPPGWLGKSWACYNLYLASKGELLLFTDADVRLRPGCLASAVKDLLSSSADLLTLFPHQELQSFGEVLLIPFLQWSIPSFYPLLIADRVRVPSFSVTVGQFIMVRRDAYKAAGTHMAVREEVVEDIALDESSSKRGVGGGSALIRDLWIAECTGASDRPLMVLPRASFLLLAEGFSSSPLFDSGFAGFFPLPWLSSYCPAWVWWRHRSRLRLLPAYRHPWHSGSYL